MPFTRVVEPEQPAILASVVDQHCLQVGIDLAGPERQAVTQLVMVLFRNGAATIEELKAALLVSSTEREEAERYGLLVLAFRNPSPREPRGIDPTPHSSA